MGEVEGGGGGGGGGCIKGWIVTVDFTLNSHFYPGLIKSPVRSRPGAVGIDVRDSGCLLNGGNGFIRWASTMRERERCDGGIRDERQRERGRRRC